MRDVIDSMPIVRALRALRKRPDRGATVLLMVLGFYALAALALPWSASLQQRFMEAHHFRPRSLWSWALWQPAPKMYGFEHRAWIGPIPLFDRPRPFADRAFSRGSFWVNHYPARRARFDGGRGITFTTPDRVLYIYLHTRYRGASMGTGYAVHAEDGHLIIRRLEAAP